MDAIWVTDSDELCGASQTELWIVQLLRKPWIYTLLVSSPWYKAPVGRVSIPKELNKLACEEHEG